jgi:hypothetical protein
MNDEDISAEQIAAITWPHNPCRLSPVRVCIDNGVSG